MYTLEDLMVFRQRYAEEAIYFGGLEGFERETKDAKCKLAQVNEMLADFGELRYNPNEQLELPILFVPLWVVEQIAEQYSLGTICDTFAGWVDVYSGNPECGDVI